MALPAIKVEYKTIDGITLRGLLHPTEVKSPAIIMTHGVSTLQTSIKQFVYVLATNYSLVQLCQRNALARDSSKIPGHRL